MFYSMAVGGAEAGLACWLVGVSGSRPRSTTLTFHGTGKNSACSFELDGLVEQGIWERGVLRGWMETLQTSRRRVRFGPITHPQQKRGAGNLPKLLAIANSAPQLRHLTKKHQHNGTLHHAPSPCPTAPNSISVAPNCCTSAKYVLSSAKTLSRVSHCSTDPSGASDLKVQGLSINQKEWPRRR